MGYLLCFGSVGLSFFLTVNIAGAFGAKKAGEWMVSFVMSFFESVFFTQPIKVGAALSHENSKPKLLAADTGSRFWQQILAITELAGNFLT